MVLMGQRRTENREDAIAGALHDVTVVAMDGADHQLQRRVNDSSSLLGVEVLHQVHRTFNIGEQGTDRFAFAFKTFSRRLLGNHLFTRRLCSLGKIWRRGGRSQACSTVSTKVGVGWV